jgi:hypothetical protein
MSLMRPAAVVLVVGALIVLTGCDDNGDGASRNSAATTTTSEPAPRLSLQREPNLPPTETGPLRRGSGAASGWTVAQALRHVGGARIHVGGGTVTVRRSTLTCWGAGRPWKKGQKRVWRRFACIAPTFRGAAAGPDALLVIVPRGRKRFSILSARFSRY